MHPDRLDVAIIGGAAISAQAFDGVDAKLSPYSYLVSLLPKRIIDDLGLDVTTVGPSPFRRLLCI